MNLLGMMAGLGMSFNSNNFAERQIDALPAGWYVVQIVNSEVKATSKPGGARLNLQFKVLNGDFAGRVIFGGYNIRNENPVAVNIAMEELAELSRAVNTPVWNDTEELHGKPFNLKVKVRKQEGYNDSNEPQQYKNINDTVGVVYATKADIKQGAAPVNNAFGQQPQQQQQQQQPQQGWQQPQQATGQQQPMQQQQQPQQQVQQPAQQQQQQVQQPQQQPQPTQQQVNFGQAAQTQPWQQQQQQQPQQQVEQQQQQQVQQPQQQVEQQQVQQQQVQQPEQQQVQQQQQQPTWAQQQVQPGTEQPVQQQQQQVQQPADDIQQAAQSQTPPWKQQPQQ